MGEEVCKYCMYALELKNEQATPIIGEPETVMICRRYPPSVHLIPQPSRIQGQTMVVPVPFYPPINPETWCGEYEESRDDTPMQ